MPVILSDILRVFTGSLGQSSVGCIKSLLEPVSWLRFDSTDRLLLPISTELSGD
jgi:hypothetical protein